MNRKPIFVLLVVVMATSSLVTMVKDARSTSLVYTSSMSPARTEQMLDVIQHRQVIQVASRSSSRIDLSAQRAAQARARAKAARETREALAARQRALQPRAATSTSGITHVWIALAHCESTDRWHVNTGNGYYGAFQITATNAAHYGFARPDLLSPAEQVRLARLVLRDQGPGAWPVCGPRVGLRRGD